MKARAFRSVPLHLAAALLLFAALASPGTSFAQCNAPIYQTDDLTSNRFSGLPNDTLQAVTFYDGAAPANADLHVQYIDSATNLCVLVIQNVNNFTTQIGSWQYDLNGATLTGNFRVVGTTPNGAVDGLAFGLYWRDATGSYHMVKSNQVGGAPRSDYVGMWPLAMSDATFAARTAQITDGNGRAQARMTIDGAALLGDGTYSLPIF